MALGLDQLDLFLIHWPLPTLDDGDYVSTWKAVARYGLAVEAHSPLGHDGKPLTGETITAIAAARGKTPAQVILRWHVQHGAIAIPQSARPERMAENLAVLDFELSAEEIASIDAFDRGESGRVGPSPDTYKRI